MGYPDRRTFEEAHERMAPPRKRPTEAVKAARARAAELQAKNFAATQAALASIRFDMLRAVNLSRRDRWHGPGSTPWTCADWSNALCGEAGELANVVKKIRRQETGARNQGDPSMAELRSMAGDELADVVIYADLVAAHFGINLSDAVARKFNRVSEKYGFPERLAVRP